METWQSWTLFLGCAGGLAYYYYPHNRNQPRDRGRGSLEPTELERLEGSQSSSSRQRRARTPGSRAQGISSSSERTREDTAASSVDGGPEGASGTPKHTKRRKADRGVMLQPSNSPLRRSKAAEAGAGAGIDEGENDKEWAKTLAATQKGVTIQSSNKLSKPARSRKLNGNIGGSGFATSADINSSRSSNGAEADDDLSPFPTPNLAAISTPASSAMDISDMLEAPAAGPSVLRLTGEIKSRKSQAPRSAPPPPETKKQRQNRKKTEMKKLQREEEENNRRVLLEKQRKSAREARGEPARNGQGAGSAPSHNVWSNSRGNGASAASNIMTNGNPGAIADLPLLDTFDQDGASTASSNEPLTNGNTPLTGTSMLEQDMPPEEEQLRMISEMSGDSGWNEVTSKKKREKKQTLVAQPMTQSHGSSDAVDFSNAVSKKYYSPVNVTTGGHVADSEWAVE